jgi:phosphatidate cytidylyltransferase
VDDHPDNDTEAFDLSGPAADADEELSQRGAWGGVGARRGPRASAEGVRIIGAEEAAAAIEAGQVTGRRPEDAPRFGDVPQPPSGPRPELRFPGVDPSAVEKPPVVEPPHRPPPSPVEESFWGEEPAPSPPPSGRGRYAPPAMSREPDDDRGFPSPENHEFWDSGDAPGAGSPGAGAPGPVPPPGDAAPLPHWTEPPSGEHPRILPDTEEPSDPDDDLGAWSSLSTGPRWRDHHTDWDEADFADDSLDDPETRLGALRVGPAEDEDEEAFPFEEAPPPPPPRAVAPAPPSAPRRPSRPGGRRPPATLPRRPARPAGPTGPSGGGGDDGGGGTDVTSRVITGVVAFAVLLVAAMIGPGALVFLVAAVLVLGVAEFYQAARTAGHHPATLLGVVSTAALVGAVYWQALEGFQLVLVLFLVFTFLWYLSGVVRARPVANIAVTVLGFLYVGVLGSFAALLLKFPLDHGIGLLLGAVIATAAYDIGAFFAGSWAGRTPLAPDISPGKTVEGLVGACFLTLAACLIVVGNIDPWNTGRAFLLALVAMVAAPLGDLCESMLKRDLNVKDMGTLLPGHGGILDRIDALLFVVPATYYVVRYLKFF